MNKSPECDRCLSYAHSSYLVCAIHPTGPDLDSCPDFQVDEVQEPEELWSPAGYTYVNDQLLKLPVIYEQDFQPRLTRAQQYEVFMNHPIFTGMCPQCRTSYPPNAERVHWDCDACGWMDDSV